MSPNTNDSAAIDLADAAHRLPELVEAALAGRPQRIRDQAGREVVLVSLRQESDDGDRLRDFLLAGGTGPHEEAEPDGA